MEVDNMCFQQSNRYFVMQIQWPYHLTSNDVNWHANFFLWGYLKEKVHIDKLKIVQEQKNEMIWNAKPVVDFFTLFYKFRTHFVKYAGKKYITKFILFIRFHKSNIDLNCCSIMAEIFQYWIKNTSNQVVEDVIKV